MNTPKSYGQIAQETFNDFMCDVRWKSESDAHDAAAQAVIAAFKERETEEGWRLLEPDSVIAEGDQFWHRKWRNIWNFAGSAAIGSNVGTKELVRRRCRLLKEQPTTGGGEHAGTDPKSHRTTPDALAPGGSDPLPEREGDFSMNAELEEMRQIEREARPTGELELKMAQDLMCSISKKHFPHNPDWKVEDNLMGVLLQISNAVTAWDEQPPSDYQSGVRTGLDKAIARVEEWLHPMSRIGLVAALKRERDAVRAQQPINLEHYKCRNCGYEHRVDAWPPITPQAISPVIKEPETLQQEIARVHRELASTRNHCDKLNEELAKYQTIVADEVAAQLTEARKAQPSPWIPVKIRMLTKEDGSFVGAFDDGRAQWFKSINDVASNWIDRLTHWIKMPLPQPPQDAAEKAWEQDRAENGSENSRWSKDDFMRGFNAALKGNDQAKP